MSLNLFSSVPDMIIFDDGDADEPVSPSLAIRSDEKDLLDDEWFVEGWGRDGYSRSGMRVEFKKNEFECKGVS